MLSRLTSRGPGPLFCIAAVLLVVTACSRDEDGGTRDNAGGAGQRPASGGPGANGGTGGGQGQRQQGRGGGGGGGFAPGGGTRGPTGPVAIEVATVTRGSLAREATVAGVLAPVRSVGVNAQLGGALLSMRVEEGDVVRAGQVLAEIDSRELRAQLRSAEASLALARSTAERSATLFKDRVVTAAENERDQAALASAQATVDALRTRLGYALVRAPIAGVVTEKRSEAGDVIGAQSRLFTIADVSPLVVRVQVSELDITGISVGQTADVSVDALGGTVFKGTVRRIFPAADSVTRMVPVEVELGGGAARQLRPGYLARVTVRLGEREGVVLAPASAVVGSRDARAVFLKIGDKVERRAVRIGQVSGTVVEILEGLQPGDTVVTLGADQLRDGASVRVVAPIGAPVERGTRRP